MSVEAAADERPLVGVIMGSDSDLPTMAAACEMLTKFSIKFEVDIVSAHRTPDKLVEYSRSAHERGLEVIVAGAGGAAHLPGMVAAMTPLPVVGVPVKTSGEPPLHTPAMGMRPCLRPLLSWGTTVHFSGGSITFSCDPNAADLGCAALSGVDSLYSIVQMPRGVPVATVAIGNATNAGLLAARIVGSTRPAIRDAMLKYQAEARAEVEGKGTKLVGQGYEAYLAAMQNKSTTVM